MPFLKDLALLEAIVEPSSQKEGAPSVADEAFPPNVRGP